MNVELLAKVLTVASYYGRDSVVPTIKYNGLALHQALQLEKNPKLLAWLRKALRDPPTDYRAR